MASKTCPLLVGLFLVFIFPNCMGHVSLHKRGNRVLHPNVKVFTMEKDGRIWDTWEPSLEQISSIENGIPSKDFSNWEESFFSRNRVKRDLKKKSKKAGSDYFSANRTLTKGREILSGDAVVEIIGFVEHQLASTYDFDKEVLLMKYADLFWNVNLRFKTLPSSNISFQINGITILSKELSESWKEMVIGEDDPDGPGLGIFSRWMRKNMDSYPKFDMAFYTAAYFDGGMAWMSGACAFSNETHLSTFVYVDSGGYGYDKTTMVSHEAGHVLAADHDHDVDPNSPGKYIMSGGDYFFSKISDESMSNLVRARETGCLRRMDEPDTTQVTRRRRPKSKMTMDEQCKLLLKNPLATARNDSKCGFDELICLNNGVDGHEPTSNAQQGAPCLELEGGICFFHTSCILPRSLIVSVASGMCLHVTDLHNNESDVDVGPCANPASQFDGFLISELDENGNNAIEAFSLSVSQYKLYTTCLHAEPNSEGKMDKVNVHVCDKSSESQFWEKIPLEEDEFLLRNRATKKCLKPVGGYVVGHSKCDTRGRAFRWRMEEILF